MKASIFIVSGDVNSKTAKSCIRAVKKKTRNDLIRELIIVEAGIRPDFNHAAEINKVLRMFTGDVLILLDDDAIVESGWLEGLMECAAMDPSVGIVGAVLKDRRGNINHSGATASEKCFGKVYTDAITRPRACNFVCSAVMLIKRDVIEKIGAFDNTFKKYGQDADYCFRAWEAGLKVVCTPAATARHLVGATIRLREDKEAVWQQDRDAFERKWQGKSIFRHFGISRRGVTYPTFACNIKCKFCYYYQVSDREHRPIEDLKAEMNLFRNHYHLEYVDISGGEPTIYKHIRPLVEHCAAIGLLPTIITNGQRPDVVDELIDLGLEDVLISIHGYRDDCNRAMNKKDAYDRIVQCVDKLKARGFSFRTNSTMISYNYKNLPKLADELVELGPRIVNFISFNPHEGTDWAKEEHVDFQVRYSELAPYVKEAIDRLMAAGVWPNVRYIPLCQLKGYEKHVCNLHQWQWDPYEWEYLSGYHLKEVDVKKIRRAAKKENICGDTRKDMTHLWIAKHRSCEGNIFFDSCERCSNRPICDGVYPQYARRFGEKEFVPVEGHLMTDPLYYRRKNDSWSILKPRPQ